MDVIISDESINSYDFWLKSDGCDFLRYSKNPIVLLQHDHKTLPIGRAQSWNIVDGVIYADIEFDKSDELAVKIENKYINKFMSGFSVGFRPIEWSEDPTLWKLNQAIPTVTRWELIEISAVTIPSNMNAVRLYNDSYECVTLSYFLKNLNEIYMKKFALILGMAPTANEDEISAEISKLKNELELKNNEVISLAANLDEMKTELSAQKESKIELLLNNPRKNLTADQKESFRKLAKVDFELTAKVVNQIPDVVALHTVPNSPAVDKHEGKTFNQLQKEAPDYLANLKESDYEKFAMLYEAEFGKKPKK
jgi:HK97 family phage prohead protease